MSKKCPYEKKCGGCQYIDLPYEEQLKKKQKDTNKLLNNQCVHLPAVVLLLFQTFVLLFWHNRRFLSADSNRYILCLVG